MGFFKKIKAGFVEGRHAQRLELNNQKITYHFNVFTSRLGKYGPLISNVSYLMSEQIKYGIIANLDDYRINRISMTTGFWLIVFLHIARFNNLNSESPESFEDFYKSVKDEFLVDFITNNPTTDNEIHFREVLNGKFQNYILDPINENHLLNAYKDAFVNHADTKIKNDFYRTLSDDFGIRLMPQNLDYLMNLNFHLFRIVNESVTVKYS